jgi:GNAT superfamily N-acetyltransferase
MTTLRSLPRALAIGAAVGVAVHHSQERFVASVVDSLADALVPGEEDGHPVVPWFRMVTADGVPAGFVMVALPAAGTTEANLWRFLVDARHQGRGIGRRMLGLVADEMAAVYGATTMRTSWVEGRGGPEPFYRALGFEPTGEIDGGEIVARVAIDTLIARAR